MINIISASEEESKSNGTKILIEADAKFIK